MTTQENVECCMICLEEVTSQTDAVVKSVIPNVSSNG